MRAALVGSLAVSAAICFGGSAWGFGTYNYLGQHSEHGMITRTGLQCFSGFKWYATCFEPVSMANFGGDKGSVGGVGQPDLNPDTIASVPQAHCGRTDFLTATGYPGDRGTASDFLYACWAYLRSQLLGGPNSADNNNLIDGALKLADELVDAKGNIIGSESDIGTGMFSSCTYLFRISGRAKCNVYSRLGAALHGLEDFYSHLNWGDASDPTRPIGIANPPGLNRREVAPFMDLLPSYTRADFDAIVPVDLSGGCFSVPNPVGEPCVNKVIHGNNAGTPIPGINKDVGYIDPVTAIASNPETPRGKIGDNFQAVVSLAAAEARRLWQNFASQLVATYGPDRGTRMVCALLRDKPVNACQGLDVAVVAQTGSVAENVVAAGIAKRLRSSAESSVRGPSDTVMSVSADAEGSAAGGSAGSLKKAIDRARNSLLKRSRGFGHMGIVVLADPAGDREGAKEAVEAAAKVGIRTTVALVDIDDGNSASAFSAASDALRDDVELVEATHLSGGSTVAVSSRRALRLLPAVLESTGLAEIEDADGDAEGQFLVSGRPVTGSIAEVDRILPLVVDGDVDTDEFLYQAEPGRYTVSAEALRAGSIQFRVRKTRMGKSKSFVTTGPGGKASQTFELARTSRIEVHVKGTVDTPYAIKLKRH